MRQGREADIVLADHDADALAWARKRILKAVPRGSSTTVTTVEANAGSLLRGVPVEMELTSGWNVAHRTVAGFEGLVRATGALGDVRRELHASGTNLYCASRAGEAASAG